MTKPRWRMCASKRRYRSESEASAVKRSRGVMSRGTQLRVYECPACGGYHLTKRSEG